MSEGKVVILDKEDFDKIVELGRFLIHNWNMTLGQSFEERRKVGKSILYRCRGTIVNLDDLEIHGSHMGTKDVK